MVPSKKNIGGWEEYTGFGGGVEDLGLNFFCDCICKFHVLPPPCITQHLDSEPIWQHTEEQLEMQPASRFQSPYPGPISLAFLKRLLSLNSFLSDQKNQTNLPISPAGQDRGGLQPQENDCQEQHLSVVVALSICLGMHISESLNLPSAMPGHQFSHDQGGFGIRISPKLASGGIPAVKYNCIGPYLGQKWVTLYKYYVLFYPANFQLHWIFTIWSLSNLCIILKQVLITYQQCNMTEEVCWVKITYNLLMRWLEISSWCRWVCCMPRL